MGATGGLAVCVCVRGRKGGGIQCVPDTGPTGSPMVSHCPVTRSDGFSPSIRLAEVIRSTVRRLSNFLNLRSSLSCFCWFCLDIYALFLNCNKLIKVYLPLQHSITFLATLQQRYHDKKIPQLILM